VKEDEFDIGYWLLDDEIVDVDGRRCGRVDDVELDGRPGSKTVLSAVLTGPGAMRRRFPRRLWRMMDRFLTDRIVRVEWKEVERIDSVLRLHSKGSDLGLGLGDDGAGKFVRKIPGS
jgi:sporulation protein YlmC with PRC-barrel domain